MEPPAPATATAHDSPESEPIDEATLDFLRETLLRSRRGGGDQGGGGAAAAAAGSALEPAPVVELRGEALVAARRRGEEEIASGRVAALLVAGGQGSRLGFDGPKGCFPIGPVSGASLFFFHARKVLALRRAFGAAVPLYVMTSATNDERTRAFFAENGFFGLPREDVFFFAQGMWPALDDSGEVLMEAPGRPFLAPDGHGGVLSALERSGAFADMEARGVRHVFHFQVDNPMTDVASPAAIGFHAMEGADATLLCCRRTGPGEKTGMPVLRGGRPALVEYIDFPEERLGETGPDGSPRFAWAAPSPYVFSESFLRRVSTAGLPVHLAHKKVPFIDESGALVRPDRPNAWKFEKFVFDALESARECRFLAFDREEGYSPVKNAEGGKSPATAKSDLSRKWARWLRACGAAVPDCGGGTPPHPVEIDPAFASDPDVLKVRLSAPGAALPDFSAPVLLA